MNVKNRQEVQEWISTLLTFIAGKSVDTVDNSSISTCQYNENHWKKVKVI